MRVRIRAYVKAGVKGEKYCDSGSEECVAVAWVWEGAQFVGT